MPLRTQKVSIDFGLGVDEFTDRKLVKEGKLIKAENVHFDGSKNVQKRAGFRTQVMHDLEGNPIEAPESIAKYKEQPVIFTANKVYTDAGSSAIGESVRWRDTGAFNLSADTSETGIGILPSAKDSDSDLKNVSTDQSTLTSGVRCCVWASENTSTSGTNTNASIGINIYDTNNGKILLDSKITQSNITTWTSVKVIPFGSQSSTPDRFIIFGTGRQSSATFGEFFVFTVRIDSNSVPYVQNEGTFWTWANIPNPDLTLSAIKRSDVSAVYDSQNSKIYMSTVFADLLTVPQVLPTIYKIEESSSASGFTGVVHSSANIGASVTTADEIIINSFLGDPSIEEVGITFACECDDPNTPGSQLEDRVMNGLGDSSNPSMLVASVMQGTSGVPATNEYRDDYTVRSIQYTRTDVVGSDIHYMAVHFAKDRDVSTGLKRYDVGNDFQEYTSMLAVDVGLRDPTPTNVVDQRTNIPFMRPQSNIAKYTSGTGSNAKDYIAIFVSKKNNKINLFDDNFGTSFLYMVEIDNSLLGKLIHPGHAVAKILPGTAFCGSSGQIEPRNVSKIELISNKLSFSCLKLPSANDRSVASFDIALGGSGQSVEFSGSLYTTGGFLKTFNGSEYVENNFHFAPNVIGIAEQGFQIVQDIFKEKLHPDQALKETQYIDPAGSTNPTYQFAFIYEWTDKNGEVHRSAPSEIVTVQSANANEIDGTNTLDFGVVPLINEFTEKENVLLKAYRTLNITSDTDPGVSLELFYDGDVLVDDYDKALVSEGFGITNYNFSKPDSKIIQNERLYISNSVVANIPPPSLDLMTVHDGRLFLLSSDNRNRIYYSKPKVRFSSAEFSDLHYIESPPDGGDINGIASLSGKLFMFKNELTLASYGSPLNESGTGGGYSPPTAFSQSIGCTNPDSVKSTDSGIFFQFYNNIYSIDRSLRLNEVGLGVVDSITSVSSIIHLSDLNELRICHDEGTVIYNTLFDQWYTSSLTTKNNSISVNGRQFCIDKSSLDLLQEDPDYFGDGSTPISTDIETAWIKMSGPQGFQRIRNLLLLGELSADTTFKLELFYDYNTYPSETINITASDIASLASYGGGATYGGTTYYGGNSIDRVFQFRHKPKIQKCESMKLRIVETSLTTPTKGYALNNMLLEVAAKQSAFKMKNAKTV
tara:strand:+ start:21016 stop:24486 length:3471 start_codon:yes stop_codon:yes gene_type:complete